MKKLYKAPSVSVRGDIRQLTQGDNWANLDDVFSAGILIPPGQEAS